MPTVVAPVSIKEFCHDLSSRFGQAVYRREAVIIKKYRDEGAFISAQDYDEYEPLLNPRMRMTQEEWYVHFATIDNIRAQIPQYLHEEIEQDIAEASLR